MADNRPRGPSNPSVEPWRRIRKDFESLPQGDKSSWSVIWDSEPPADMFGVQAQSHWTWFHPMDPSLRARANAIFLRAANARGYDSEDHWLDELRLLEFVNFRITGESTYTLPDGTVVNSVGGLLKDVVKHSITLCHLIESGAAPMPITGRLPDEAIARIEAAAAAFTVNFTPNFVPKLQIKLQRNSAEPARVAELLQKLVVHHFETAARECMAVCTSMGELETELQGDIARFVRFNVRLYEASRSGMWLSPSMCEELDTGFKLFARGADPWAGIARTERETKWHVGAITAEALSYAALRLMYEASERAVGVAPKADQTSATEPDAPTNEPAPIEPAPIEPMTEPLPAEAQAAEKTSQAGTADPCGDVSPSTPAASIQESPPADAADRTDTQSSIPLDTPEQRRAAVTAYIDEAFRLKGKIISRKDIWKVARYKTGNDFYRWQRCSPRTTKTALERFRRILLVDKPHLK